MNGKQKAVLLIGLFLIIAMAIYPPWLVEVGKEHIYRTHYSPSSVISGGYDFIFYPPKNATGVDLTRLFVQLVIIVALTAGAYILLIRRKVVVDANNSQRRPFWNNKKTIVLVALIVAVFVIAAIISLSMEKRKKAAEVWRPAEPAKTEAPAPAPAAPAPPGEGTYNRRGSTLEQDHNFIDKKEAAY